MQTPMPWVMPGVVVAVLIIIVVSAIYGWLQAQKRLEALNELALRLGLNFSAAEDYSLAERYGFLKQLAQGEDRYARNVLAGNYQNNQVLVFDYHYATYHTDKNGTHKEDHWFSFFILTLPIVFPDLTIRRENLFTRVAEVFGYQDIKFESAEFSKAFNVRSSDKKFAYAVCDAKMMEYLLANRDLSIEIENNVLALAFNTRLSVERIEADLQRLVEIRSRLPDYLFANTCT
jgi:hypothetical protein